MYIMPNGGIELPSANFFLYHVPVGRFNNNTSILFIFPPSYANKVLNSSDSSVILTNSCSSKLLSI